VKQYVHGNPTHATDVEKAKKPLAAAEVVVQELEGNPGYYRAEFHLKPHYQLEGLTVALKLVSRLKSEKK
jgi:type VI secretion system protein ImpC